ncbi:MAG TPA: hypothetical protein VFN85_04265 [Solirubrobacterales bacterium]|nr:hypothetical protein [Solirubrobacterales bacterium]
MSYRRAAEAAPLSGAASVTVCTNDLALCNLVEHVLPSAPLKSLRDRELLVSQMVELEDEGIVLSAIDTGVLEQERDYELRPFFDQRDLSLAGGSDVTSFVRRVVLLLVLRSAGPAIVVPLSPSPSSPSEFLDRLLRLTAPTQPHGPGTYRPKQTFP